MKELERGLAIELHCADGAVERTPATLVPCFEDAFLRGLLSGEIPNDGRVPRFGLELEFTDGASPSVDRVRLSHAGAPVGEYTRTVFAPQARALARALVQAEKLAAGDTFEWCLLPDDDRPGPRFAARVRREPLPFVDASLPEVARGELQVEVTDAVLDALRAQIAAAGRVECAALLLGQLYRDPQRGGGLLSVRGKVEVEAGSEGASAGHFAFDAASFTRALATARARNDTSVPCGWIHSHLPCADCEQNPSCKSDVVFFSEDDERVQLGAFPSAWALALVGGKVADQPATHPGFRAWGWRGGRIVEVPFRRAAVAERAHD